MRLKTLVERGSGPRPHGIVFLALLFLFITVYNAIMLVVLWWDSEFDDPLVLFLFGNPIELLVAGIISAVMGIGLWKLFQWARVLTILNFCILFVISLLAVGPLTLDQVISAVVIWYMFREDVRLAFRA